MTNFEPRKLPPLTPPGKKVTPPPVNKPGLPTAPNSAPQPPQPFTPPAPSNLPPRIGTTPPPPPPPLSRPQPTPPPAQFPPTVAPEPTYVQPEPEVRYTQEPVEPPQQTWEEKHLGQQRQEHFEEPEISSNGWGTEDEVKPKQRQVIEEPEEEPLPVAPRGRKSAAKTGKAAKVKPQKGNKKQSAAKETKVDHYAGDRKKLLGARIAVFGTIGVLIAAGIFSFIPKASYLTENDQNVIISKVRADLGETYFPSDAGEGWAKGFLDMYLNYTPETAEARQKQLLTYTTEDVLRAIDVTFLTENEINTFAGKEDATAADLLAATGINDSRTQVVTAGPYLVKKELLPGDQTGIFSYKVQINNNNWAYIEVPIYYNMENRALSVSGTPTFRSIIPISTPPAVLLEAPFDNDRDVAGRIEAEIREYMKAWVSSDQTGIDRFLVKEGGTNAVTPQASTGLGGSVKFLNMDSLAVQLKAMPKEEDLTPAARADFNERYVSVSIRVIEPTSGIVYKQNYQLVIQYVNENWFVQDIRNVAVFADIEE